MQPVTQTYQPQPGQPQPQPPQPPKKKTPFGVKLLVVIAIVVVCLIWLGSCAAIISAMGDDPATSTSASPAPASPTSPPASSGPGTAQSYASVTKLRNAVVKAGYPCPKWKRWKLKGSGLAYAKEAGACSDIDYLSTYVDASAVAKQVDTETGVVLIVGPNWILFIPDDYRELVHAALGGKVVDKPKSEAESKPTEPGIGDKVTDDDYQFTVTKVRCGVSRVGDQYSGEKAQGQYCIVSMRIKNVGKEPINFSDENQALIDTKGKNYSPDDAAWIYLDTDPYAEINPGNVLKTVVPFDMPKKARPDYLLLKAGTFGFSEGVRVKL
jgi:Domain of unknown function (DUF4352)